MTFTAQDMERHNTNLQRLGCASPSSFYSQLEIENIKYNEKVRPRWNTIMVNNDVEFIPKFYTEDVASLLFSKLNHDTVWSNELQTVDGSTKKIRRKMAYFYDRQVTYKYANFLLPGQVWNSALLAIKYYVEERTALKFNSVLLNLYEDGKDEIKWHADKEKQLGEYPTIASLNLGATRNFHMINRNTSEKQSYPLSNGDLLIMKEYCQVNWLHAILPEKDVKNPRISLTFRWVYDDLVDKCEN